MDQGIDLFAPRPAAELEAQIRLLGQLGLADHRCEVEPLLAGHHRHADPAVLGRLDRRHLDRAREAGKPHQGGVQPLVALHTADHALEQGDVDVAGGVAPPAGALFGHDRHRRVHAAGVLAHAAADRHRRGVREAAEAGRTAPALECELGGRTIGPRAVPSEVGDRHERRLWVDTRDRRPIRLQCRRHDDGVGPPDKLVEGAIAGDDRAALSRAQVVEQRAFAPHRNTVGRLDLDDVGAGVGQQLRAVRAGDALGQVEDSQIVDRRRHGWPSPSTRRPRAPRCSSVVPRVRLALKLGTVVLEMWLPPLARKRLPDELNPRSTRGV